jgi:hypothetical protein
MYARSTNHPQLGAAPSAGLAQRRDRSNQRAHEPMTELTHNLEQFLEHESQETELLAGLGAALETHRKAMNELADALAQVRQHLFL